MPYFLYEPQDLNLFEGSTAEFRWIGTGYEFYLYRLDNVRMQDSNENITYSRNGSLTIPGMPSTGIILIQVSVPASMYYNQHTFACEGFYSLNNDVIINLTKSVMLQVQGMLQV